MVDYVPIEKGVTIRQPSTANLMISSMDRQDVINGAPVLTPIGNPTYTLYPSPWDFQITKTNSIMNGYFTRVATTEVVLEWFVPNISPNLKNRDFTVVIAGTSYTVTIAIGFYTVAQALDQIVGALNAKSGISGVYTFSIANGYNASNISRVALKCVTVASVAQNFTITETVLSDLLDFAPSGVAASLQSIFAPDLRPYRYIDFTSSQLTYAQDLKDGSTNTQDRNVLCRWYFDFDNFTATDTYGFPILMGYQPFTLRRIFNPPKQIRWEPNLPIGNLSFQVVDEYGQVIVSQANQRLDSQWLMTLQVSEV
jgi:hypothetical protein